MALNTFVKLYAKDKAKDAYYDYFVQPKTTWDKNIAHIRLFQTAVIDCLKGVLTPHSFARAKEIPSKPNSQAQPGCYGNS